MLYTNGDFLRPLDLLFPPHCPYCGALIHTCDMACSSCLLLFPKQPVCKQLYGYTCVSPFRYEGIFRKAILRFKFYNSPQYAKQMAAAVANAVRREYSVVFDFVTCVPLSAKGRRKRGYNQAALLAKQTALHLHLPYKATLIKIRENTAQHSLPKAMRWENVQGVYAPRRKTLLNGKSVLLIDDIVTTGNTLRECAHVLEKSGATVWCATLASVE